jgi:hypothetical protein
MPRQNQGQWWDDGQRLLATARSQGKGPLHMERVTGIKADRFREVAQGHMTNEADAERLDVWLAALHTRPQDLFGPAYLGAVEEARGKSARGTATVGTRSFRSHRRSYTLPTWETAHPEKLPLAQLVTGAMVEREMSPHELGGAVGEHRLQIKQIMEGHRLPQLPQFPLYERALGLPAGSLEAKIREGQAILAAASAEEPAAEPVVEPAAEPVLEPDPVPAPELLATRIEDMDWTLRTFNCLKKAGVNTLGQLVECHEDELTDLRNFGRKSLYEVRARLQQLGLALTGRPVDETYLAEAEAAELAEAPEPEEAIRNGAAPVRRPGRTQVTGRVPAEPLAEEPLAAATREAVRAVAPEAMQAAVPAAERAAMPSAREAARRVWDLVADLVAGCPEIRQLQEDAYELVLTLGQGAEVRRPSQMVDAVNKAWARCWRLQQGLALVQEQLRPGTVYYLEQDLARVRATLEAAIPAALESVEARLAAGSLAELEAVGS